MTATDSRDTPSPLARALAEQAAAQLDDLRRARGLDGSTFSALAARAREIRDRLDAWDVGPATTESIALHTEVKTALGNLQEDLETAGREVARLRQREATLERALKKEFSVFDRPRAWEYETLS